MTEATWSPSSGSSQPSDRSSRASDHPTRSSQLPVAPRTTTNPSNSSQTPSRSFHYSLPAEPSRRYSTVYTPNVVTGDSYRPASSNRDLPSGPKRPIDSSPSNKDSHNKRARTDSSVTLPSERPNLATSQDTNPRFKVPTRRPSTNLHSVVESARANFEPTSTTAQSPSASSSTSKEKRGSTDKEDELRQRLLESRKNSPWVNAANLTLSLPNSYSPSTVSNSTLFASPSTAATSLSFMTP